MARRRARARASRHAWAALLGFLAVAGAILRVDRLGPDVLLAGMEPCDTVPFALTWAIGWGLSRIDAGFVDFWAAPIFHPIRDAFALSEPMPLVAIMVWPLHAVGVSLTTCCNVAVVAALVLAAVFMRRLLLRLGTGHAIATLGGVAAIEIPFVHQELGVLPLTMIWPLVWVITAVFDLFGASGRTRPRRAAIELGIAVAVSWACCAQLTLVLVLALVPATLMLLRREHLSLRWIGGSLLAFVVAGAAIGPLAWTQRRTLSALSLERSEASQTRGAAKPRDLVRLPWTRLVPLPRGWVARDPGDRAFAPGPAHMAAALIGVGGLRRRAIRRRRAVAMLLTLVITAVLLAMAPVVAIADVSLADVIDRVVPGYAQMRAVFRVIVVAQIAALVLAMLGLRALQVWLRRRRWRSWPWLALAMVVVLELVPPPPRVTRVPDAHVAWVEWLRAQGDPELPIAWIPFAPGNDACDFEDTARMMLLALRHRHPMVNGYSSYFPAMHNRLSKTVAELPGRRAAIALWVNGVRYVVAADGGPLDDLPSARAEQLGIERVFRDDDEAITIFALVHAPRPDPS